MFISASTDNVQPKPVVIAAPRVLRQPARRQVRVWLLRALALSVLFWAVWQVLTNQNFGWEHFRAYFFHPSILQGVWLTIWLAIVSMAVAVVIGVLLALMERSKSPGLRTFSRGYVALFRSVPMLVQLLLWYNIGAFWPVLGFWIPFTDIGWGIPANNDINGVSAAILALGLQEAAYMSEIVRAGLVSVPDEQVAAARGLGMTSRQAQVRVVLPQAVPVMLPPTGNAFVGQIKSTSLVAVIGGGDLLTTAQHIYQLNYRIVPLLLVASAWYLVLTIGATMLFYAIEARFGRSSAARNERARLIDLLLRPLRRTPRGTVEREA